MIYFNFNRLVQLVIICTIFIPSIITKSLNRVPRIIGGLEAEPSEFPFIVSLQIKGSHKCGGSILNSEWIITAAHCFRRTIPHTWYSIVAGQIEIPLLKSKGKSVKDQDYSEDLHHSEYDQQEEFLVDENEFGDQNSTDNSETQISQVIQLISHPQWSPRFGLANDIALLRISPPLNFTQNVQPISFAHSAFAPVGNGTAIGWGVIDEDDFERSEHLRKVDLPLVTDSVCRDNYNSSLLGQSRSSDVVFKIEIVDSMICAGSEGLDSCRFDSGGPLICDDDEKLILCGITSWGNGCGVKNFPGVYTEVSYYFDWIVSSTTNSTIIEEFITNKSINSTQSSS